MLGTECELLEAQKRPRSPSPTFLTAIKAIPSSLKQERDQALPYGGEEGQDQTTKSHQSLSLPQDQATKFPPIPGHPGRLCAPPQRNPIIKAVSGPVLCHFSPEPRRPPSLLCLSQSVYCVRCVVQRDFVGFLGFQLLGYLSPQSCNTCTDPGPTAQVFLAAEPSLQPWTWDFKRAPQALL